MKKHLLFLIVTMVVFLWPMQRSEAQLLSLYSFETGNDTNMWRTLTTSNITCSGDDSRMSAVQNIGFTFMFCGMPYTQWSANTNGNIHFGSDLISTGGYSNPLTSNIATNVPKIVTLGVDGYMVSGTHYVKSQLFGTAGNRVFVIEYCNGTYTSTSRNYRYRCQIHLSEADGSITLVFPDTTTTNSAASYQMGIARGAGDFIAINVAQNSASSTTVATQTAWPGARRYYKFTPPPCWPPALPHYDIVDSNSMRISWTGQATRYIVEYGTSGFNPGTGLTFTTTRTDTTLTALRSGTAYEVYVSAICDTDTAQPIYLTFGTIDSARCITQFPYRTGFEYVDDCAWDILNGTNIWTYGTATKQSGQRALYISSSGGRAHGYEVSQSTYSYAMRNVRLDEPAEYVFDFDWMCYGEGSSDYMRALLAPVGTTINPTTANGITATNVPTGWYNVGLNGTTKYLSGNSAWRHSTVKLNMLDTGTFKMIFYWVNNASGGTQPPAAVDNVQITRSACPSIHNLKLDSLGLYAARISWDRSACNSYSIEVCQRGDPRGNGFFYSTSGTQQRLTNLMQNTWYTAYVWSNCYDANGEVDSISFRTDIEAVHTIPYETDFEDYEDQAWEGISSTANVWVVGNGTSQRGQKSLHITNNTTTKAFAYNNTYSCAYVWREFTITQAGTYNISFDWKCEGELNGSNRYDYMRAFFIPTSTTLTSGRLPNNNTFTNANINTFSTAVPTGWIDVGGGVMFQQTEWKHASHDITLTASQLGTYKLLFVYICNSATNTTPAAVENVRVGRAACPSISNLTLDTISGDMARISWNCSATRYVIEYDTSFFMRGRGNIELTNSTNITLNNLQPLTQYDVYLYGYCSGGATDTIRFTFTTPNSVIVNYPYSTGFEPGQDRNWDVWSTSSAASYVPNAWAIGQAKFYTDSNAIYISNNGGVNYTYNNTYTVSCISREFYVADPSNYSISFDWTCVGQTSYDYMRVFIVPASTVFTPLRLPNGNTFTNANISSFRTATPSGWIDVYGGSMLSQSTWKHFQKDITINARGRYRLVFMWINNTATIAAPAAVDNVRIARAPCPTITGLYVAEVTGSTATIKWDASRATSYSIEYGPEGYTPGLGYSLITSDDSIQLQNLNQLTSYDFYIFSNCMEGNGDSVHITFSTAIGQFPYRTGFEPGQNIGWNTSANTDNKWAIGSAIKKTGNQSLYISNNGGTTHTYTNAYATAYAWIDLSVTDTMPFTFTFDWLCQGQNLYDYLRVFLVPASVSFDPTKLPNGNTLANNTNISNFKTTTPAGWIDLNPTTHWMYNQTTWTTYSIEKTFTPSQYGTYHLTFFWVNNSASSYVPAAIDNLQITHPLCDNIRNLRIASITDSTARIEWDNSPAGSWFYEYDTVNFQPGYGIPGATTNNYAELQGLRSGTEYTFIVYSRCFLGDGDTFSINFTTRTGYARLPYRTGFERGEDVAWTYVNNTTNGWYVGEATNNGGSRSLYISNDQGASNLYTLTTAAYSWAYRRILIADSGRYVFKFNWKAQGQTSYDYLRFFLVPDNVSITNAVQNGVTSATITPSRWINLGTRKSGQSNYVYLSQEADWKTVDGDTLIGWADTGVYKLVAYWTNNTSSGTQPPAAIDNVEFYKPTCPRIEKIWLDSATANDMYISWQPAGSESKWEIVYDDDTIVVSNTPHAHLTRLNVDTRYLLSIRAICSTTDTSRPFEFTFRTACNPESIPFTATFNNMDAGYFDEAHQSCWSNGTFNTSAHNSTNFPYLVQFNGSDNLLARINYGGYLQTPDMAQSLNQLELTLMMYSPDSNDYVYLGYKQRGRGDSLQVVIFDTVRRGPAHEQTTIQKRSLARVPAGKKSLYIGTSVSGMPHTVHIDAIKIAPPINCDYVDMSTVRDSNTTTDQTTLIWDEPLSGASYLIEYGPRHFTPGTGFSITSRSNTVTLSRLDHSMPYHVYISTICGNDTIHGVIPYNFSTQCDTISNYPYTYNFDNYIVIGSTYCGILPNCWDYDPSATTSQTASNLPQVYNDNGNGRIEMTTPTLVTLPPLSLPIDTIMVTFDHTTYDTLSALVIGSVRTTTAGCNSTFVPIDTIVNHTTGTQTRSITRYLVHHTGTGRHLAFKNIVRPGLSATNSHHSIDNLTIQPVPSCLPPINVRFDSIGDRMVTLDWDDILPATQWVIEYDTAGFRQGSGQVAVATQHPFTITGLMPNRNYVFYVRNQCSRYDQSIFADSVTCLTLCGRLALPYTENFNSTQATTYSTAPGYMPNCWDRWSNGSLGINGTYIAHVVPAGGSYCYSPDNSQALYMGAQMNNATNGQYKYAILPYFEVPIKHLKLSFHYRMESTSYGRLIVGYLTGSNYATDFVGVDTMQSTSSLRRDSVLFSNAPDNAERIVFCWENHNTATWYSVGIDNVSVVSLLPPPSCDSIDSASVAIRPTYNTISLNWNTTADSVELVISDDRYTMFGRHYRTADNNFTFRGLLFDSTYFVGLRTVCNNGASSRWTIFTVVTPHLNCQAPINLRVEGTEFDGATLQWDTVGPGTEWELWVRATSGGFFDSVYRFTDFSNCHISGLTSQVTYEAMVRSRCGDNHEYAGPWSTAIRFTTDVCFPVGRVQVTSLRGNSALAVWPSTSNSNGYYVVEYGDIDFPVGFSIRTDTIHDNNYIMTRLEPESYYDVYVKSICDEGVVSQWSNCTQFLTREYSPSDPTYYVLTSHVNGWHKGRIDGAGVFVAGSTVTLTATAFEGYRFVSWHDGTPTASRQVTMDTDHDFTAYFAPTSDPTPYHIITVASNNDLWGTVRGTGLYRQGDTATLYARAKRGYHFLEWDDGYPEPVRQVVVNNAATFTALFDAGDGIAQPATPTPDMQLMPNPATNTVGIRLTNTSTQASLRIIDIHGREVLRTKALSTDAILTIDISHLASGTYLVQATTSEATITRRLIKR